MWARNKIEVVPCECLLLKLLIYIHLSKSQTINTDIIMVICFRLCNGLCNISSPPGGAFTFRSVPVLRRSWGDSDFFRCTSDISRQDCKDLPRVEYDGHDPWLPCGREWWSGPGSGWPVPASPAPEPGQWRTDFLPFHVSVPIGECIIFCNVIVAKLMLKNLYFTDFQKCFVILLYWKEQLLLPVVIW